MVKVAMIGAGGYAFELIKRMMLFMVVMCLGNGALQGAPVKQPNILFAMADDWGARVPLVVRWGNEIKHGRNVTDFVSLTDLAPTFLVAAGVDVPSQMTGKSLIPILKAKKEGRVGPKITTSSSGVNGTPQPSRCHRWAGIHRVPCVQDKWLLILNLEPDRWPAGVPEGASHPKSIFTDADAGQTKSLLIAGKDKADIGKYYQICFARRPAVELYDCISDPDQVNNLAGQADKSGLIAKLHAQLTTYLKETNDPRFTDLPVKFDTYIYTASYMAENLKKHGY